MDRHNQIEGFAAKIAAAIHGNSGLALGRGDRVFIEWAGDGSCSVEIEGCRYRFSKTVLELMK